MVIWLKGLIVARFKAAESARVKVVSAVLLWVVAAGSKFVVRELVDLVFGDKVSLGGFFSVTGLGRRPPAVEGRRPPPPPLTAPSHEPREATRTCTTS